MLGVDEVNRVSLCSSSVASKKRYTLRALAQRAQALAEMDIMDERKKIKATEMLLKQKKKQVCLKTKIGKADALVALSLNSSNSHVYSSLFKFILLTLHKFNKNMSHLLI